MKYKINDIVIYKGKPAKIKDICLESSDNDYLLDNLAYVKETQLSGFDKFYFDNRKETKLDNIKFEIKYFWDNSIIFPLNKIKTGIKNLWVWFPIIWKDRWYDYDFIINILRFKLLQTANGWNNAHYCESEKEQEFMYELVDFIDEIERLEEESISIEDEEKIDLMYQELGRKLFDIQEVKKYNCDGDIEAVVKISKIRSLWD